MRQPIENVERPLVLFLIVVVLAIFLFFGIRHSRKVRESTKREEVYQSTLASYRRALKSGTKRTEVERYLRSKNIEFLRSPEDDITKIGEDDFLSLFCGRPDVFVQFRFITAPQQEPQADIDDGDALGEIEIIRKDSGCI